jgi:hypothetical protein
MTYLVNTVKCYVAIFLIVHSATCILLFVEPP